MPAQMNWEVSLHLRKDSARFIRDAINYYRTEAEAKGTLSEEDNDMAWEIITMLMQGLRGK